MLRRNAYGLFWAWIMFLIFLVITGVIIRGFIFSEDWQDTKPIQDMSRNIILICIVFASITVISFTLHGQLFSKAKKYKAFAIVCLFVIAITMMAIFGIILADFYFEDAAYTIGAIPQISLVGAFTIILAATYLYTMVKFPDLRDVRYIQRFIDKRIKRALDKPDTVCGNCRTPVKDGWEYCPSCGGLIMDEDALLALPIEEKSSGEVIGTRRGLFGRKKKEIVEEIPEPVIEKKRSNKPVEKKEDKPEKKQEKPKMKKKAKFSCEECGSLLEVKSDNRPLHVRCPSCKHIMMLEE